MKEEEYNKIEAYIKGLLSEKESLTFEKEVAKDSKLARELEHLRFQQEAMEVLIAVKAKEKAKEWIPELAYLPLPLSKSDKSSGTRKIFFWGGLSLVITLVFFLIILSLSYFKPNDPPSSSPTNPEKVAPNSEELTKKTDDKPKEVATIDKQEVKSEYNKIIKEKPIKVDPTIEKATIDYFASANIEKEHKTILITTLGDSPKEGNSVLDALKAYEDKHYTLAIEMLSAIKENEKGYDRAQEALAHAYFHTDQYDKAITSFQNLLDKSASRRLRQDYEWHLLLSYFGNYPKYKDEFNTLAEKIINQAPNYKKRAEVLIDAAKKIN